MNGAFYIGATGLSAQQRGLDVIANNITNLNTPTFKRSAVRFGELVAPGGELGAANAAQTASLGGVFADTTDRVLAPGEVKQTGDWRDLAIKGEGMVELLGPGGQVLLWRGGATKVNADGLLAAANGMPLKAMISVPFGVSELTVDPDGKVYAVSTDGVRGEELGQIELVRPDDLASLTPIDGGLYAADDATLSVGPAGEDGVGTFVQGAVETSNVQLADEMVMLLLLQRAYAASAQVVQAGDQLMAIANGLKR